MRIQFGFEESDIFLLTHTKTNYSVMKAKFYTCVLYEECHHLISAECDRCGDFFSMF